MHGALIKCGKRRYTYRLRIARLIDDVAHWLSLASGDIRGKERWPSGRRRTPGKRVYEQTRIEGSNPSLSAIGFPHLAR